MKSLLKNGLQVNSADRGEPMKILNFWIAEFGLCVCGRSHGTAGRNSGCLDHGNLLRREGTQPVYRIGPEQGAEVYHAGLIGEEGEILRKAVADSGADTSCIETIAGKSGHTIIQVDQNGQNCILLYGGANRSVTRSLSTG